MTAHSLHLSRRAFVGGAAAFGVASLAVPHAAFADPTSAEVQAQADAARVKLDDMQARLAQASDDYFTALEEHDAAMAKMEECQTKIDENNVQIASYQERLGGRAKNMYINGQTTFLDIILGSSSFDDFLKNWDALQAMNNSDAELVATTKALREDNETQKAEYQTQADLAQQKMDEAEKIKNEAEQLVQQYQDEVNSLDAEVAALVQQEQEAAAEAAAAEEAARFEQQALQQAANSSSSNTGSSNSNTSNSGSSSNTGNSGSSNSGGSSNVGGSTGGGGTPNTAALGVAQTQLGVPYVWGGSTPGVGLDCSGLTSYCYSATGYSIGRTTGAQYASARYILSMSQAEPGDVLYTGGHVGICAASGGGSYIHAPQPGQVVCYSSYQQFYCALRW